MSGNILGAHAIQDLLLKDRLTIDPFFVGRLGLAHYTLRPGSATVMGISGSHAVSEPIPATERGTIDIAPHAYVLVRVKEHVVLPNGTFGRLVPTSSMIERGFIINSGKVDAGFGVLASRRQFLIVGVYNSLPVNNELFLDDGLVHLEIIIVDEVESRLSGDQGMDRPFGRPRVVSNPERDGPNYEVDG